MIKLINGDCMEYMKTQCDQAFDLAIVDPPYGIGENWKKDKHSVFYNHSSTYKNQHKPSKEYFDELFRVSKNQIIWGANYYCHFLPQRQSWLAWDKNRDYEKQHMAEGELAWHSFNKPMQFIRLTWNGAVTCQPRYGKHPHEKPVALYEWLVDNFCNPGDKIIDTHLGSGSSAVACHRMGYDFVGIEIDNGYFEDASERVENSQKQNDLFNHSEVKNV